MFANGGQQIKKKIGNSLAKTVFRRLNELLAAPDLWTFLNCGVGHPELLTGNLSGSFSVRITANYRLIIKPSTNDLSPDGLKTCTSVIIEGVTDYHGNNVHTKWLLP